MNPAAETCWHCGEPLPNGRAVHARIDGVSRVLCSEGCRAAAEWIEQLGLSDYYRLRTEPAQKPDPDDRANEAWERAELARHVVRELGGGRFEAMLLIDGVRCAGCVWLIERAVGAAPGVEHIQVNALARRARVVWNSADISLPRILELISRAGYRALPLDAEALDDVRRDESRAALKRLLVAGFGAMQAMMYAAVLYLGGPQGLDYGTDALFRWLGFLVATPVVFYSARPFFSGALRSLRGRRLNMDVPVAIAVGAIYAASLVEALRGGEHVYFDSVSMFVFFLLAGRYLEMRARHRAGDLTDALARLTPPFAERRGADGTLERISVHEIEIGDRIHVGEGGVVPADGLLESGRCRVDESLLSGESTPLARRRGERLLAGSLLVEGPAEIRVDRTGADTTLAGIAALVHRAQAARPKLARAGERAAARFVARVLAVTVLTAVGWSFFDPARAFTASLAVLVVSCPCAFALAIPAAITRALAVLARRGVLVVEPDAIETLAGATHVVFDKTGTLAEPSLALTDVDFVDARGREEALRLAVALARESRHPAARAIAAAHPELTAPQPADVVVDPGFGVRASVGGRRLYLGRHPGQLPAFDALAEDAVVLADEAGPIAAFRLTERLRPGAREVIDALRAKGIEVLLASGDARSRVEAAARELGIPQWRARQLPEHKLAWLAELRAGGARVVAVGDGINDAPVLAGADVAVAVAGGAELAQATSDIVIPGERLAALTPALEIAQRTLTVLAQNHRWALCYNLTAVPLAALGFVPPWLAALGMSLSSLGVVLNSLRIGRDVARTAPAAADGAPVIAEAGAA